MGKKDALAHLLFFPYSPLSPVLGAIKKKKLFVLAYHRIFSEPDKSYPFNPELISASPEQFDRQLSFLKRYFNIVNFRILSEIEQSGEEIAENTLIITFDDGYFDNWEIMTSIVTDHNVTAAVYVSTDYVEEGKLFWVDRMAYQINKMDDGKLMLDDGNIEFTLAPDNRQKVRGDLGKILRRVSDNKRLSLLDELENQAAVNVAEEEYKLARPLRWNEVDLMSETGIEIGSHTLSHPFLENMDELTIKKEIIDSKLIIEQKIKKEVTSISYPAGNYNQYVLDAVKEAGYKYGVGYRHGLEALNKENRLQIPRIHIELDVNLYLFKANMLMPELFVR